MTFLAIPAIDVRKGRIVRLNQGDYARETVYGDSPLECARTYAQSGAAWLHLVDLDAAREGGYTLLGLLADIRRTTSLKVQTGGGIRSEMDVEALLAAGADRVVVGTLAVREPERVAAWLQAFGPDRIVLALDAREDAGGAWRLPVRGWTEDSAQSLDELLSFYADAGLVHLLCTDIARDGMLTGFNVDLYRILSQRWPALRIQASGGVRGLDDIRAARAAGASAAILGRGLLEGRFTVNEALSC